MPTTTILFCRHGETEWNSARKFQGSLDIPLNEVGRQQAEQLAGALATRGVGAVWCSPLIRAHTTAKAVADTCRVPLRLDDRLRERHLGMMQGLPYRAVKKHYPVLWSAWTAFKSLPPEAGAEANANVVQRLESVLFQIAALHPDSTVAVVGHSGLMRCLLQESGAVGNGSITTLVVGPGHQWRLIGVDDEEHLPKPSLKLGDLSDPDLQRPMEGIPITTVLLCRHGESVGNSKRFFQGGLDLALTDNGRLQSHCLGRALRAYDLAALWTSPLARAQDTASEISALTGVPSKVDTRLKERSLGKLEGISFREVKERLPHVWTAWRGYLPLPAEIEAEPRSAVCERLEDSFFELATTYPGRTVAVVIHGANGRCLLKRSIGNASITTLQIGPGREWHVRRLGDAEHLPWELREDAVKASKL